MYPFRAWACAPGYPRQANSKDAGSEVIDGRRRRRDPVDPGRREEPWRSQKKSRHGSTQKKSKTKADLAKVLASGDERTFMKILREIGLKDDSPEFGKALKAFRDLASRR
jgi:hypothetical protein